MIGSSTGVMLQKKLGSSLSGLTLASFRSSMETPPVARSGTSVRRFSHLLNMKPNTQVMAPISMPPMMDSPTFRCRSSTTATGPGCGTVMECVTVPPQQIAIRYSV